MSITYTYESSTMYLYTLKVHCTIGITKLEHSCEIDEVYSHCFLSLYSTGCLLITLMKAIWCLSTLKVHLTIDIT